MTHHDGASRGGTFTLALANLLAPRSTIEAINLDPLSRREV